MRFLSKIFGKKDSKQLDDLEHKYQLVLEFPYEDSERDFDRLLELEDALTGSLDDSVLVDGHDYGSGFMNIFIHTNDPRKTFQEALQVLINANMISNLNSGYRDFDQDDYIMLWPGDSSEPFELR
ncbi:MAG: hypothetical protein BBJ57_12010 [Desulfobacterales bacterium PC51MH44]|nr:MAG: hypothetical protein BBJ57_12010 [Desulfobacterales bacterium PC51MH44]